MNVNVWSFIGALLCIPLFLFTIFTPSIFKLFQMTGTHPLNIVFGVTLVVFFLGLVGLKDMREWKSISRSIVSLLLTALLMVIIGSIIIVGSLLK
ncbi:hypothetical protein M3152_12000 [Sporosarcina luteola]|uniref:hypothetical protein n=1 Tax=Bacillales TaxID=1385 RepID=UPI00203FC8DD|nr:MULTISPECIES: hypothetical protein [Bacillales]MCM3638423.1 hypothetical protein [Sporosarcina luteola]